MSKKTHKKLAKQVKRMRSFVTQVYRDNPKSLLNYKQLAAKLDITDAVQKQILDRGSRGDGEGWPAYRGRSRKILLDGPYRGTRGNHSCSTAAVMAFVEIARTRPGCSDS